MLLKASYGIVNGQTHETFWCLFPLPICSNSHLVLTVINSNPQKNILENQITHLHCFPSHNFVNLYAHLRCSPMVVTWSFALKAFES